MEAVPYYLMAAAHLAVLCGFVTLWWRDRSAWPALVMMVVTAGIAWDNVMIASGEVIGDTETLRRLSLPRFWVHGLFTPMLMLVALAWGRDLGVSWARSRVAWFGIGVLTAVLVVRGFWTDVLQLEIETTEADGLFRYTYSHPEHSLPAPIITVVVLIAVGLAVWRAARMPWLLGGSVFMFLASGGGTSVPYLANVGETVLALSLLMTGRAAFRARRGTWPAPGGPPESSTPPAPPAPTGTQTTG